MMRGTAFIGWHDATQDLPDDDITVLVALNDGEVWTGFMDAGRWRFVSGDLIGEFDEQDGTDSHVTHWAHFPPPPQ